jgi:hypothetical protein
MHPEVILRINVVACRLLFPLSIQGGPILEDTGYVVRALLYTTRTFKGIWCVACLIFPYYLSVTCFLKLHVTLRNFRILCLPRITSSNGFRVDTTVTFFLFLFFSLLRWHYNPMRNFASLKNLALFFYPTFSF